MAHLPPLFTFVTMRIFCCLFALFLIGACGHRKTSEKPYVNSLHLSPAYLASLDTVNYTIIQWEDTVRDFGSIKEGDSVTLLYKFSNAGDKPLLLMSVKTSCGCTVARFPQNALFPGEEGEIEVIFNSHDHPGPVLKSVTVVSNTSNNAQHIMVFKGNVTPKK